MSERSRVRDRRLVKVLTACVVAAAVAYSWYAASTRPFTTPADIATAVPFLAVASVLAHRITRKRSSRPTRDPKGPADGSSRIRPWVITIVLLGVIELVAYVMGFFGSRHEYPTLSSLYESAARTHGVRAVLFALWMILGWRLVR